VLLLPAEPQSPPLGEHLKRAEDAELHRSSATRLTAAASELNRPKVPRRCRHRAAARRTTGSKETSHRAIGREARSRRLVALQPTRGGVVAELGRRRSHDAHEWLVGHGVYGAIRRLRPAKNRAIRRDTSPRRLCCCPCVDPSHERRSPGGRVSLSFAGPITSDDFGIVVTPVNQPCSELQQNAAYGDKPVRALVHTGVSSIETSTRDGKQHCGRARFSSFV
jgi:hypothetical protein